jgi:plasmid replication initiation protein
MVNKVNELTLDQLKTLINELIDEKLEQMIKDPDEGLEFRPEFLKKLKASKNSKVKTISMEQICKELGINLEE